MSPQKGDGAYYRTKNGKLYSIPAINSIESCDVSGVKEVSNGKDIEVLYYNRVRKHSVGGSKGIKAVPVRTKGILSQLYGEGSYDPKSSEYHYKEGEMEVFSDFGVAGTMDYMNPPTGILMTRSPSGNNFYANVKVERRKEALGRYVDISSVAGEVILRQESKSFGFKKSVKYPDGSIARATSFKDSIDDSRAGNSLVTNGR